MDGIKSKGNNSKFNFENLGKGVNKDSIDLSNLSTTHNFDFIEEEENFSLNKKIKKSEKLFEFSCENEIEDSMIFKNDKNSRKSYKKIEKNAEKFQRRRNKPINFDKEM